MASKDQDASNRDKRPTPGHEKSWWHADRWISLSSALIALCALTLTVYQGYAVRKHNRISVRPYVKINYLYNQEGSGFVMERSGLGPAILKDFQVFVDHKAQTDWLSFYRTLGLPNDPNTNTPTYNYSVPSLETVYLPGASNRLFWLPPGPASEALKTQLSRLAIFLCYASFYDEYWYFTTEGVQEMVDRCPQTDPPGVKFIAPPEYFPGAEQ